MFVFLIPYLKRSGMVTSEAGHPLHICTGAISRLQLGPEGQSDQEIASGRDETGQTGWVWTRQDGTARDGQTWSKIWPKVLIKHLTVSVNKKT